MDFHIEDVGEGRPVLFIHAGVADSRMWGGQLGLNGLRTITFDKRGFGRTPFQPESFSDSDDTIAVLDHLDVDSAVIVGCSMGGETALDLAISHPERVDSLVLIGAIPNGWEPANGWKAFQWATEAAAASENDDLEAMIEVEFLRWVVGNGRSERDIAPEIRDLFYDMDRIALGTENEREGYQTGFEADLNAGLESIRCPTLVMVGAHDEPVFVEAAHYLAARLGDRPTLVIPEAAHLAPLEQSELFNRELLAFLGSI
jgi:3-oxoadipate enol-lactonase